MGSPLSNRKGCALDALTELIGLVKYGVPKGVNGLTLGDGTKTSVGFTIVAPDGFSIVIVDDPTLESAYNNSGTTAIGGGTDFRLTATPTDVFQAFVEIREAKPAYSWTFPSGGIHSLSAYNTSSWTLGGDNSWPDTVTTGIFPVGYLWNGSSYVDYSPPDHNVKMEYYNGTSWVEFKTHPHKREFRGSDKKARVTHTSNNTVEGGWHGPLATP